MSDFPSLCAQCLGDKDRLRMVRQPSGEQCKLCTRPFTVFRWNIKNELNRLKKTIICMTCAHARNCCQSCMLDVDFGIPLDLRDAALKMAGIENQYAIESTSRNSEVKAIMADKQEAKNATEAKVSTQEKREKARAILQTLATKLSGGKRLPPKEKTTDVSSKDVTSIVSKLPFGGTLSTPSDGTIKSFFVFGFSPDMPQYAVSSYFETFGTLNLVKIIHKARCGYVTFATRKAAEDCAKAIATKGRSANSKTAGLIILEGLYSVRVSWGEVKPLGTSNDEQSKIGLVVAKVMKQLADKDAQMRVTGHKDKRGSRKTQPGSKKEPTKSQSLHYQVLSKDFEL